MKYRIYTYIYKGPKYVRAPAPGWEDLNIHSLTKCFCSVLVLRAPFCPVGVRISCPRMKMQTPICSKQLYFAHIACSVLCLQYTHVTVPSKWTDGSVGENTTQLSSVAMGFAFSTKAAPTQLGLLQGSVVWGF